MREKAAKRRRHICAGGITPAYAGKSTDKAIKYLAKRDHPRVCGEKKNRLERGGEKADHPRMCGEKSNTLD